MESIVEVSAFQWPFFASDEDFDMMYELRSIRVGYSDMIFF